jgi:uncharacterized membrane protein
VLTKEQADTTSEALLEERRIEQASVAAKVANRRRAFAPRKWTAIGGLLGLAAGGVAAYYLVGLVFPWDILGVGVGAAIGSSRDKRDRSLS